MNVQIGVCTGSHDRPVLPSAGYAAFPRARRQHSHGASNPLALQVS